jgi:NAD(P)-dependent dehydrogenase (short-subunit alcohol dehydrogenase family)
MSSSRFAGHLAVVTGGASGIGRGIGDALLANGSRVVALDRAWPSELREPWIAAGGAAEEVDIGEADMSAYGRRLLADHGPIDLVVNNVGITTPHRFLEVNEEHFDRVMAVNLRGPWFLTKALVTPLHEQRRRGSVLFISSVHDTRVRLYPHYAASKAAIVAAVRELAHELAPLIRVNAISPGWIDTASNTGRLDEAESAVSARIVPLGRPGRPSDVAPTALHLLDDVVSPYTTGVSVAVDGGLLLHTWLDTLGEPTAVPPQPTAVRHLLLEVSRIVEQLHAQRARMRRR